PVGREVVARLRPCAPAPDLWLILRDVSELLPQPLPVVEVAVQGEMANRDVVPRLDSPVPNVRAGDPRAPRPLPVEVVRGVAAPAHLVEFPPHVEPRFELRQAGGLAVADDVQSVPERGGWPRALQGRHLELDLERLRGREVVIEKHPREPP